MPVNHDDFLNSASEIALNCTGEMAQRNALSRAYYATYHKLVKIIIPDGKVRTGINGKALGTHKNYLEQLCETPKGCVTRKIGVKMSSLYQSRINADYKPSIIVSASNFAVNIGVARDVFLLADQFSETGSASSAASITPNTETIAGGSPPSNTSARPRLTVVK
ncbi:MAG: hypothetical protein WC736_09845 [Gallionella sp.]|jgi:hypothetical protein